MPVLALMYLRLKRLPSLLALVCVWASLFAAGTLQAHAAPEAQNRIGAFEVSEHSRVGDFGAASAEARWRNRSAAPAKASVSPHAAKAGAQASKASVQFGRTANQVEHAFRHTDKMGLSRSAVQNAIQQHLPSVANKIPSGRPLNQVIEVGGQRIQYSAFRLPDGTINVGRIHGAP